MSFENKAGIQAGTEGPGQQRALLSSPMESDDVCKGNVEQLASIFDELETSNSGDVSFEQFIQYIFISVINHVFNILSHFPGRKMVF